MEFLRTHRGKLVLAVALIGALLAWFSGRGAGQPPADVRNHSPGKQVGAARPAQARDPFDFYLMALTVHSAFCADGHAHEPNAARQSPRPLVIHGLWPERLEPRTYPHDCPAPPLQLDAGARTASSRTSCPAWPTDLHEHEWREHGGCSGLDDDVYFSRTLDLARGRRRGAGRQTNYSRGPRHHGGRAARDREPVQPGHRRHAHVSLSTHARRAGDRPISSKCASASTTTGRVARPARCSTARAVKRRDQGCGRPSGSPAAADEHATARAGDRLWRHRGRDARRPAAHARRPARVFSLACLFGHGDGARRRVMESAGASTCCRPSGPWPIRARCISAPWVSIRRWELRWGACSDA